MKITVPSRRADSPSPVLPWEGWSLRHLPREARSSVWRQRGLQGSPGLFMTHPSPVYTLLTPRTEIWGKAAWSHSSKEDKPEADSMPWRSKQRKAPSMTSPPFPQRSSISMTFPQTRPGKIRHDVSRPPPGWPGSSFSPRGRKTASQKWLCLEVWVSGWPLLPLGPGPGQARLPRGSQESGRSHTNRDSTCGSRQEFVQGSTSNKEFSGSLEEGKMSPSQLTMRNWKAKKGNPGLRNS